MIDKKAISFINLFSAIRLCYIHYENMIMIRKIKQRMSEISQLKEQKRLLQEQKSLLQQKLLKSKNMSVHYKLYRNVADTLDYNVHFHVTCSKNLSYNVCNMLVGILEGWSLDYWFYKDEYGYAIFVFERNTIRDYESLVRQMDKASSTINERIIKNRIL